MTSSPVFFRPLLACLALLLLATRSAAEQRSDIVYGEAGGQTLLLDAGIPDTPGVHPIVVMVHGGGWTGGDKAKDMVHWLEPLRQAGFTWVSINYRLAPAFRWPACAEDVRTALRWVKMHAGELRGDPSKVILIGHSAGGHLATYAAVTADQETAVQAVIGLAAVSDFEQDIINRKGLSTSLQALFNHGQEVDPEILELLRRSSTLHNVGSRGAGRLPPFLLVHGDADRTVQLLQSQNLQARLREHGGRCDLIVIPGAPHRLTEWAKHDPDHIQKSITWLRRTLATDDEASGMD